ncbi:hypothetical protein SPBRAN_1759 [uncultured Candidatus Thioglobus sp.]|nr:hypothetical protein SPBRAN_1759 [uncultured Candidatus Thioglobus sp.]
MKKLFLILIICLPVFTKNAIALTYSEIDSNARKMTEAQFDEYTKTLKGLTIEWTGKVTDVDSNLFGSDYEVNIDMDNTGIYDTSFDIDKYIALKLYKSNSYKFTGKIKYAYASAFGGAKIQLYNVNIYNKSTNSWSSPVGYQGSYKDGNLYGYGVYHGYGTYTLANGTRYQGNWENGKEHGQGVLTEANGNTTSGLWVDGECPNCSKSWE